MYSIRFNQQQVAQDCSVEVVERCWKHALSCSHHLDASTTSQLKRVEKGVCPGCDKMHRQSDGKRLKTNVGLYVLC